MGKIIFPLIVSLLLIGGGVLLLLYNVGLLGDWGPWVWTAGFAVVGLVFLGVFVMDRKQWWAIIPGGALLVMTAIPVLDLFLPGDVTGALFFVGMGLVFGVLYLLRSPDRPLGWAIWPALGCCAFGLFVLVVSSIQDWFIYIGPVILVLLGVFLIGRALLGGRRR